MLAEGGCKRRVHGAEHLLRFSCVCMSCYCSGLLVWQENKFPVRLGNRKGVSRNKQFEVGKRKADPNVTMRYHSLLLLRCSEVKGGRATGKGRVTYSVSASLLQHRMHNLAPKQCDKSSKQMVCLALFPCLAALV